MKKIWFRRKRYGWGWTPSTVEGWLLTLAFIVAVFVAALVLKNNPITQGIVLCVLIVLFLIVTYSKAEKPLRWQWGNKGKDTQ